MKWLTKDGQNKTQIFVLTDFLVEQKTVTNATDLIASRSVDSLCSKYGNMQKCLDADKE